MEQYLSTMLEGLWQGGRPHTYILGLSKVIRILETKGNKTCLFIDIPLEPSHLILGILPDNLEENSQTKLLRALLLIANKVITSSWLKPQPPTITQWRDRIQYMYRMEHLTALLQLKTEAFINNWSPIAIHFHLIR